MAETEDIDYQIDDFAIDDIPTDTDEDKKLSPRNALVKELRAYLKKAIGDHNSFDVLNIPQNAKAEDKIAVFDEMFNHKGLVHHLRQIEQIINDKVKEN
jgi:hypothetical protein